MPQSVIVDGTAFELRDTLLAEDWDLFARANDIIGDIRKKKMNIDTDKQEIEINSGDFTTDQFLEFASMGFVGPGKRTMTVAECAKLSLPESMNGFTNFFFIILQSEISWSSSSMLNNKVSKFMKT